jgi:hypothetical protein
VSAYNFGFGVTNVCLRVKLNDSSQTSPNNKGITGLTNSSTGLIIATIADGEASSTNYTQGGGTIQTITTIGTYAAPSASNCRFKEIDSTNLPGIYELQLLNARWAVANAKWLQITFPAVSGLNLAQMDLVIPLPQVDPYGLITPVGAYPNIGVTESGTAAAVSSTSLTLRGAGAAFGTNACAGMALWAFGSTQGYWQTRVVTSNTSGSSGVLTVDAWSVTPSGTVTYILFGTTPISSQGVTVNAASILAALGMAASNMDTQLSALPNIQGRLPASLLNGVMRSDVSTANGFPIIGTGATGNNLRPSGLPPTS